MRVIGLHGFGGVGKDVVADMLGAHYLFERIAFADPLYRGLSAMFGIDPTNRTSEAKRAEVAETNRTLRELLQSLGSGWGRDQVDADVWVRMTAKRLREIEHGAALVEYELPGVVFTDVRMANEAQYIKSLGGEVWKLTRPGVGPVNDHSSENGLPFTLVDKWLHNTKGVKDWLLLVNAAMSAEPCNLIRFDPGRDDLLRVSDFAFLPDDIEGMLNANA